MSVPAKTSVIVLAAIPALTKPAVVSLAVTDETDLNNFVVVAIPVSAPVSCSVCAPPLASVPTIVNVTEESSPALSTVILWAFSNETAFADPTSVKAPLTVEADTSETASSSSVSLPVMVKVIPVSSPTLVIETILPPKLAAAPSKLKFWAPVRSRV